MALRPRFIDSEDSSTSLVFRRPGGREEGSEGVRNHAERNTNPLHSASLATPPYTFDARGEELPAKTSASLHKLGPLGRCHGDWHRYPQPRKPIFSVCRACPISGPMEEFLRLSRRHDTRRCCQDPRCGPQPNIRCAVPGCRCSWK